MRFEIESFNTEHLQDVKETCEYDSSILLQLQQRREYFLSVQTGKVKQLEKNRSNIRNAVTLEMQ